MATEVWEDGKTHKISRAKDGKFGHGAGLTAMNVPGWAGSLSDRMDRKASPAKRAAPAKATPKTPAAPKPQTRAPKAAKVAAPTHDPAAVAKALSAAKTTDEADRLLAGHKVAELRAIAKASGVAVPSRATKPQIQEALHRWATASEVTPSAPAPKKATARAKPKPKQKPKAADLIGQENADVTAAFGEVMNGTYAGLEVRVDSASSSPNGAEVTAKIYRDGKWVGTAVRTVGRDKRGDLYAKHVELMLSPQVQGQGFAQEFNGALENWYRQSGVKRIELHANIDIGGYAWSRQGYDFPDGKIPDGIVNRLRRMAKDDRGAAKLLKLVESGRQLSAYELGQYGRPAGAGRSDSWVGKALLLGSGWDGVRWL